jgi:hypothetical protein
VREKEGAGTGGGGKSGIEWPSVIPLRSQGPPRLVAHRCKREDRRRGGKKVEKGAKEAREGRRGNTSRFGGWGIRERAREGESREEKKEREDVVGGGRGSLKDQGRFGEDPSRASPV